MRVPSDLRLLQGSFAALLCILLTGTVATALALQYIWGFSPCELCLMERIPYYIGALLMALTFVFALYRGAPKWIAVAFIITALLMLFDAGLSVYHVGVEMGYWPGPEACSSNNLSFLPTNAAGIMDNLDVVPIVPCDQAAGYIFGISFAGWNAIATCFYGLLALFAAIYPFLVQRKL